MGAAATAIACVLAVLAGVPAFERLAPARAARLALALERRRCRLSLRSAAIPGALMPYLEGGSGAPVVLLHGFAADKDNFTRAAGHLTGAYRVVIPDLPGFGDASRDPQASYGIDDQVANLKAFLDALGLSRVHLGGNSMGGFIAARFAQRHPGMVASLWLLDAAGTEAAYDNALLRRYRDTGEMPLLLRSPAQFDHLLRATMARRVFIPWSIRHELARRGAADFALHTRIMREVHASPLLAGSIGAPALVVWGENDQILSPAGAAALQAILPDSRMIVMPGIGHLPMVEAPRAAARAYRTFLGALPA